MTCNFIHIKKIDKYICGYLARFLRMSIPDREEMRTKKRLKRSKLNRENVDICSKSLLANVLDINDELGTVGNKFPFNTSNDTNVKHKSGCTTHCLCYYKNQFYKRANIPTSASQFTLNDISPTSMNFGNSNLFGRDKEIDLMTKNMNLILHELRYITDKVKENEDEQCRVLDWKFAAMVIDRSCIVLFTIATIVSTLAILLTAKNFFNTT
jgi:hypothetical protein